MKKALLLLSAVGLSVSAMAQITLTAENYPVWGTFHYSQAMSNVPFNPVTNGTFDLTGTTAALISPTEYYPESIPFFTNAGIDLYFLSFQPLTGNVGYDIYLEYDHNAQGVFEAGHDLYAQAYSLENFTGSNLDSLTFPSQRQLYANTRPFIQFPATAGTNWSFASRRTVDFNLTVGAYGLNNVPGQHVFSLIGTDSIIGWGQMRVPGLTGVSDYFNVLIKKNSQYTVDSMYLGGQPAPAPLLAAFNMTQGQVISTRNRYFVLRENFSTPFALFSYPNSNFTSPTSILFDSRDLIATGVEDADAMAEATLLYPNPVSGGQLHLQVFNATRQFERYAIIDLQGRTVQQASVASNGGLMTFATDALANGNYILQLIDTKGQQLNERFSVQH